MSGEPGGADDSPPPPPEAPPANVGPGPTAEPAQPGGDDVVDQGTAGVPDIAPPVPSPPDTMGDHGQPNSPVLVESVPSGPAPQESESGDRGDDGEVPVAPDAPADPAPVEEQPNRPVVPATLVGEPSPEETSPGSPEQVAVQSDTFVAAVVAAPNAPPAVASVERRRFGRSAGPRHRRSRGTGRRTLAIVAVLVILGGSAVAARATVRLPLGDVRPSLPSTRQVGGSEQPLPWPSGVQAAMAIPSLGVSRDSGPETPAPIASLTKMMTAYIVLSDHPLSPGEDGPSVTVTPADVATEIEDENTDQANLQVATGEVLTELQMLEGMLIHSANNFADLLADWDAGSVPAFVAKMNAAARALGMTQTTYTDASGFSTQSVSTPADQLKLASVLVQKPVFDEVVDNTSVTLPVAGTVGSYTPLVGVDDVIGVKSGFTSAAGGCDVLALSEQVDGVQVEVLASVTGFQGAGDVITDAALEALSVARAAIAQLHSVQVVAPGQTVGVARAAGYSAPVVARSGISVLVWPGQQVVERLVVDRPPPSGAKPGWLVGSVTGELGQQEDTVPAVTSRSLPTPTFFQRVF